MSQFKRDRRSLPMGLRRYKGDQFERLHRAGCRVLTGSLAPAWFGQSSFAGPYAVAAHIAGKAPLPEVTSELARFGGLLEGLVQRTAASERGWVAEPIRAYATHPDFKRLLASPDGLMWRPDRPDPGANEVKVVNEITYRNEWQLEPPVSVQLQHQTQLACTRAEWGCIVVLVLGTFTRKLEIWDTVPDHAAMGMILDGARELFALLDADQLPPPDPHPASLAALYKVYPQTDPGLIHNLPGEEAAARFDQWRAARKARLDAQKVEKDMKGWLSTINPEAGIFQLDGDRRVICKIVETAGYTSVVDPGSYRKWSLKPPRAKK